MSQLLVLNLVLCLLLFLIPKTTSSSSSSSSSSRSLLRSIEDNNKNDNVVADLRPHDYAVDINVTNFDAVLRDTPATFAVVEFFAHWCPACRNYKPHYERVARLFNGPDAVHPGIILMTRVDCALKGAKLSFINARLIELKKVRIKSFSPCTGLNSMINSKLCDKFSVDHYPMLFWAPPSKFVSGGWKPKQEKNEIRVIDDARTADRLLNWINKQMGSSFGLDDEKFENDHLSSNVSDPGQIARAVYDVEEATSATFDIILEHKMIKSETRGSLIKFLQLLVAHHPSKRCRMGSAEVLVNFDELCPLDMDSTSKQENNDGNGALGNIQICGKEVPRGYWMFCRGSKNETRGFSCGLWVLLHSLSVRIEDGESQFAFQAICEFVHNFFICEECRQHFYEMCSSVSSPFNKTRDFALWLWSAHNKVNERLIKEEATLRTGDPKFPKMIWPPKQLCSSCRQSQSQSGIQWDQDEVLKFLTDYYGKKLVSIYKDKNNHESDKSGVALDDLVVSTNAFVVPLGAALAIAVASCAFGALACYWRSQQKSRKYFHQLHSYKEI